LGNADHREEDKKVFIVTVKLTNGWRGKNVSLERNVGRWKYEEHANNHA